MPPPSRQPKGHPRSNVCRPQPAQRSGQAVERWSPAPLPREVGLGSPRRCRLPRGSSHFRQIPRTNKRSSVDMTKPIMLHERGAEWSNQLDGRSEVVTALRAHGVMVRAALNLEARNTVGESEPG